MKRIVRFMLTPLLVLGMFTTVFASSPGIIVNNNKLPVSAVSKEGRVLVPLRAIFESLDATVDYDSTTKTITGYHYGKIITLKINDKVATVDGEQVTLDVPATVIRGATLVPVRFIGESLGANVEWYNHTVLVNSDRDMAIYEPEPKPQPKPQPQPQANDGDIIGKYLRDGDKLLPLTQEVINYGQEFVYNNSSYTGASGNAVVTRLMDIVGILNNTSTETKEGEQLRITMKAYVLDLAAVYRSVAAYQVPSNQEMDNLINSLDKFNNAINRSTEAIQRL